ncbi:hypothetical protein Hypma_016218 [Hypsizygus marmoreus]|uniref:Uncharacterized protein n=1 Tax=Hypsizygus marmoreus TaxID=39966 RepID=A0A369J5F6_HYPMA|nr:hypothetical protein Hypma_016218 [Hypsizygus marmoreus]
MPVQDRGANYNAFGYDPKGHKAYLSSLFYGPDWVPKFTPQQFGGRPEPPRYGPPARYQRAYLPEGWTPRPLPDLYNVGEPFPPFFPPPNPYDPEWCAALLCSTRFMEASEESDSDESDVPTSPIVPYKEDLDMSDEDDEDDTTEVIGEGEDQFADDDATMTKVVMEAVAEMEGMEISHDVLNFGEELKDMQDEN